MVRKILESHLNNNIGSDITVNIQLEKRLGCSDIQSSAIENDGKALLRKTPSGDFIFTAIDTDDELAYVDDINWVCLVVESIVN